MNNIPKLKWLKCLLQQCNNNEIPSEGHNCAWLHHKSKSKTNTKKHASVCSSSPRALKDILQRGEAKALSVCSGVLAGKAEYVML